MTGQTHPLAWSQTGDAIELPAAAVLWRVRRLNGNAKGGAPEMLYGADGLPLLVDIGIGPQEFAAAVDDRPGKYRLDALDEDHRPISGVPAAYVMVQGKARDEEPAKPRDDLGRAFEVIERVTRTVADAMDRQSSQIATLVEAAARLVGAADRAGVTRRNDGGGAVPMPPAAPAASAVAAAAPAVPAGQPAVVEQAEPEPGLLDRVDHWVEMAMPFMGPLLPQIGMAIARKVAPNVFPAPPPAPAAPAASAPSPTPAAPPAAPAAEPAAPAVSEGGES